jgi:nicotinamide phosphoribosyltransferase
LTDHGGFLPIEIKALPEGMIAPTGVPLAQVENTDARMPWLTTFVETALLRAIWGEGALVAVVSDSYDLDAAVADIWGGTLREKVLTRKGSLVVRPDSGDPVETPVRTVKALWEKFGGSVNGKGYRVLDPHVRVIQGDGMNIDSIARLVERMVAEGFAIDNIAFGMGGGLLQQINRDTLRFAMKANAMRDAVGLWRDVCKAPATDPTKGSKAGRQAVVRTEAGLMARRLDATAPGEDQLVPVWRNGELLVRHDFEAVRARSEAP